jgi:transposase
MRVFIGLDVSLAKTAICVVDREGAVQWQGKVPSEPGPLIKRLAEWLGIIELAGIEACPLSEWLHRGLREAGIGAVHPAMTKEAYLEFQRSLFRTERFAYTEE